MKAVKRIVVVGATAGLILAGAGAAAANDGHSHGKWEKKHSKHDKNHHKYGKKHGKKHGKHGDTLVFVNKNTGAQGITSRNSGLGAGDVIQADLIELNHFQFCNNSGGILAAQNASINNSCANAPQID
ncbi:hypothetical protein [Streptomyces meridianus]|uniref:Uncharacterized protein n=1 Tax=Streptomyces meridianus TaxID=2938945 RepID=A0ABT0X8R7_9ACTN|nr:hypothetical protein [Streptomyces meridianus]MCM2578117.1 hypothetical protein [Streptomyces meridianus]